MADTRYWPKEFLSEFIALYKSYPCLWKVKSEHYKNKYVKKIAYDMLVSHCRKQYPEANRDFVFKKIQSIRGSFRKELQKIAQRRKAGKKSVYKPSLWYFDLLKFTAEQQEPTASISSLDEDSYLENLTGDDQETDKASDEHEENETYENTFKEEIVIEGEASNSAEDANEELAENYGLGHSPNLKEIHQSANFPTTKKNNENLSFWNSTPMEFHTQRVTIPPAYEQTHTVSPLDINPSLERERLSVPEAQELGRTLKEAPKRRPVFSIIPKQVKRMKVTSNEEFMEVCKNALQKSTDMTEYEAIGISVAKKLQRMDPIQALYAESVINEILKRGLLKKLTENTAICERPILFSPTVTSFSATPSTESPQDHFPMFRIKEEINQNSLQEQPGTSSQTVEIP